MSLEVTSGISATIISTHNYSKLPCEIPCHISFSIVPRRTVIEGTSATFLSLPSVNASVKSAITSLSR